MKLLNLHDTPCVRQMIRDWIPQKHQKHDKVSIYLPVIWNPLFDFTSTVETLGDKQRQIKLAIKGLG